MSALATSFLIFVLAVAGILIGARLRKTLPDHHLRDESRDVIRLGAGLIATMAALVLGLLIASAKSSFDTQSSHIRQITADVILLDNLLREYGPETLSLRSAMRSAIASLTDQIWRERDGRPYETNAASEKIYLEIQGLMPRNDVQRSLQSRAVEVASDLIKSRLLLYVGAGNPVPGPFLAILAFWIVLLFASFSMFSELNPTASIALSLFALSAACAIYLILELSQPFSGLMTIPQAPLRRALAPLGP